MALEQLFRPEALQQEHTRWLGGPRLGLPVGTRLLTLLAVTAAAIVIFFLLFGTYTRKSLAIGQLVPREGLAAIIAPTSGAVSRVLVVEGSQVVRGQALAVIAIPRASLGGDTGQVVGAGIEQRRDSVRSGFSAQALLLEEQRVGLVRQLAIANAQLKEVQAELETRKAQVSLSRQTLSHFQKLGEQKYVSALEIQKQQAVTLEQTAALQSLQRQALEIQRQIAQLQQSQRELPAQLGTQQATMERDLALLGQETIENSARNEVVLKAPVSGTVSSLLIHEGQSAQSGQAMMSLLPKGSTLEAQLFVPSRAIGFIHAGTKVQLRYQAYPYQKFGHYSGQVTRISRSALSPTEVASLGGQQQAGLNEPMYRIVVALDKQTVSAYGSEEELKPGMQLEADILLERRRLIEWVFEPLYSLQDKLSSK